MKASIRLKLIAVFTLNLVFMLAIGAFAIFEISEIGQKSRYIGEFVVKPLIYTDDINLVVTKYRVLQIKHAATQDVKDMDKIEDEMHLLEAQMVTSLQKYDLVREISEEEIDWRVLNVEWPKFVEANNEDFLVISHKNNIQESLLALKQSEPIYTRLQEAGNNLKTINQDQSKEQLLLVEGMLSMSKNLILVGTILAFLLSASLGVILSANIKRKIDQLVTSTTVVARGDLDNEVHMSPGDEFGVLAIEFNKMVANLRTSRDALLAEIAERKRTEETIRAQSATIRELGTPLIPLVDGVVLMPLIGTIDSLRADEVMQTLLTGVAQNRAKIAILDITGVPVVDTQVANALIQAAQAVKLLGAQVVLTGIHADVAQMLVQLGIDLRGIITYNLLQSGITYALDRE